MNRAFRIHNQYGVKRLNNSMIRMNIPEKTETYLTMVVFKECYGLTLTERGVASRLASPE